MKILIACEESQTICVAFRELWYEAYSCDILPCSWWHPERHIQWDAIQEAYSGKYEMMIAHPPCTYLSNAGACRLYPKKWILDQERYNKWLLAKDFFMKLYNAPIKYICIENPIPSKIYNLPKYSQIIQPYQHWHPYSKKTCLRLKNLPLLQPTDIIKEWIISRVSWWSKDNKWNQRKNLWTKFRDSITRSKTFSGIAKAITEQRSVYLHKR